jgi:putative Mn2+ efflux pump MntP
LTNPYLIALAFALAIDAFSVAASAGPRCCPRWGAFRLGFSFGLFQALMPLLGAFVGAYLYAYVRHYDHWVAFALLAFIGAKMLFAALRHGGLPAPVLTEVHFDPSLGWSLLGLSLATSIDAFGAGLALRMAGANLWLACPLIGLITAGLTYFGTHLGVKAERHFGPRAELLGGLVLLALAVKMLGI